MVHALANNLIRSCPVEQHGLLIRRKLLLSSIAGVVVALLLLGSAFKLSETHSPPVSDSTCPAPGIATCNDCLKQASTPSNSMLAYAPKTGGNTSTNLPEAEF